MGNMLSAISKDHIKDVLACLKLDPALLRYRFYVYTKTIGDGHHVRPPMWSFGEMSESRSAAAGGDNPDPNPNPSLNPNLNPNLNRSPSPNANPNPNLDLPQQ